MSQPHESADPTPAAARRAGARRSSRWPYAAGLLAALGVIGWAWFSRTSLEPVVAGVRAPAFTVQTLDGKPVGLDAYAGKVVLLNVWASWCVPCETEMPSMERLYRSMAGQPFEILAVSVDAAEGDSPPVGVLDAFVQKHGLTFPILYSEPEKPGDIQRIFQTAGVPESFLIGKDGVIYRRVAGPTEWDSPGYREQIQRLIEE